MLLACVWYNVVGNCMYHVSVPPISYNSNRCAFTIQEKCTNQWSLFANIMSLSGQANVEFANTGILISSNITILLVCLCAPKIQNWSTSYFVCFIRVYSSSLKCVKMFVCLWNAPYHDCFFISFNSLHSLAIG